jgi:predicted alpha/beta superfamily hydrolase
MRMYAVWWFMGQPDYCIVSREIDKTIDLGEGTRSEVVSSVFFRGGRQDAVSAMNREQADRCNSGHEHNVYSQQWAELNGGSMGHIHRLATTVTLLAAVVSQGSAQERAKAQLTPVVIGYQTTIHSTVLDEDRDLLIYMPPNYLNSERRYPVLYLLDGRGSFHHATASVELLARTGWISDMIVIGIANVDRTRDFTFVRSEDGGPNGGGERFLRFLESEVVPFVDSNFRTYPHRTVVGHSLGGLCVFTAMISHPDLFHAYIAVSPALSADERSSGGVRPFSSRAKEFFADRASFKRFVYVTMSSGEQKEWHQDLARFKKIIDESKPEGFEWHYQDMPDEDHGSTVLKSTYDGLRSLYAGWKVTDTQADRPLEELEQRYNELSERFGYVIAIPEEALNRVGYRLLGEGKTNKAINVFERTVELYPDSANAYDSLGEALEAKGMLPGALRNYRAAVDKARAASDPRAQIFEAHLSRVEKRLEGRARNLEPGSEPRDLSSPER